MAKRIIAGILGVLAAFGSLLPLGYAYGIFRDFGNPEIPFWPNVVGVFFMGSIAVVALWIGVRFLQFASTGQSRQNNTWARPVLLGIGLFFPGFVFSFLIATLCVSRTRPDADGGIELAFVISVCVGVATTIISTVLLLRKRVREHAN
jgi:hypothetical protein